MARRCKKKSFNTTNSKAATFKKSQSSRKQSCSADIGNSLDNVSDLEKSFDSQETISEEMTETEFNSVMSKPKSEKSKRRIVRTSSDSEDFNCNTPLEINP